MAKAISLTPAAVLDVLPDALDAVDEILEADGDHDAILDVVARLLDVAIYDANSFTLFGSVVTAHVGPEVYRL